MYDEVSLVVLVDDMPSLEGVATAHGLSILIRLRSGTTTREVLFDAGPSAKILRWNLEILGERLSPSVIIGSVMHFHHLGALAQLGLLRRALLPPPPLSAKRRGFLLRSLPGLPGLQLLLSLNPWPEQALLVESKVGNVLIVGCSIHGFYETFGRAILQLGVPFAVVGGLGLSARDAANLSFLRALARAGTRLFLPLHSTAWEARRLVLEKYNNYPLEFEVPGAGCQVELH